MEFTTKEKAIVVPGCIERYQFYKLSLDALGCLMQKSCALYVGEVNKAYATQIEKIESINSVSSHNYRAPRKHPVKLKMIKHKWAHLNKVQTSKVDVQIVAPHPEGNKIISLQKNFNSPDCYAIDFVLDNYVFAVKDEYKALTKKWIQVINTLNHLSDEISTSLKLLLSTYGEFINDSDIKRLFCVSCWSKCEHFIPLQIQH